MLNAGSRGVHGRRSSPWVCMINGRGESGGHATGRHGGADVDSTLVTAYLDHAATTPMLPEAIEAMTAELAQPGNASSLHTSGRRARRVVEEAREQLAAAVGAGPSEVVFTAGGTEADNLAVKGLFWARRTQDPRRRRVLASAVEHHAVLDPVEWLAAHEGAEVEWLPVDELGRVDLAAARRAHRARPRQRRPGHRDVGQQRGRHRPADRGARRARRTSTASPCTATPSRPSASCRSTSPPAPSTASR